MRTENHPIDQLFKEKLGNFEKNPPAGLLEQINQKVVSRGKVRQLTQLKTFVAIAAAVVMILMAGWFTMDQNEMAKNQVPLQIQQNASQYQIKAEKQSVETKAIEKQLSLNQQKTAKNISAQPVKPVKSIPVKQKMAAVRPASSGNDILTAQSVVNEQHAQVKPAESAAKQAAVDKAKTAKEKNITENGANNYQKKNEPLYFANSGITQAVPAKAPGKGNWGLKAEISPMVTSQNQAGSVETKQINTVSGGMIASYQVSKRIKISSGIRISQMKQDTHSSYTMSKTSGITYLQPVEKAANLASDVSLYLPAVSSIVYSNGMKTNPNDNFVSDIAQQFKYLEVPVQATYKVIDTKFSVGVTGGLSTNFLIGNYATITQNGINLSKGSTDNLRNVLYSGSAGVELGYGLGKNLMLTVEPRLKQYLNSVSSNDMVNYKPLQMGIYTGIAYSF